MDYSRQQDLVDAKIFRTPIKLIGAGGIGSFTGLTLAKMGFKNITAWDGDRINKENIPNQFYQETALGTFKTIQLRHNISIFTGTNINDYTRNWNVSFPLSGLVIMAVDSMQTREEIFNHIITNKKVIGFIDGRMGGQQGEVYTVNMSNKKDVDFYQSRLWKSHEVAPIPCTQKAIIYNVVWIASMICNQARLLLEGKIYKRGLLMDFQNTQLINLNQTKVVRHGQTMPQLQNT